MIHFMCTHPDVGRGRLRYKRENKKRLDDLWEELTLQINYAGNGPQKLLKEWAKTWRDRKSNLLKRVAIYKSYIGQTGGGPPISLDLSPANEALLDFVTRDAFTSSKNTKSQQVEHLFQQYTSEYSDVQHRMLQRKREKLELAKEKFEFKKKLTMSKQKSSENLPKK